MKKEKDYKKELENFRKHFDSLKDKHTTLMEHSEEFEQWLDNMNAKIHKACIQSLKDMPAAVAADGGCAEAFFLGLARYTCRLLRSMELDHMFKHDDGLGFYTKVLMPMCYDIVKSEMETEKIQNALLNDIANLSLSADDIIERHFASMRDEHENIRQYIEEARKKMPRNKEVN